MILSLPEIAAQNCGSETFMNIPTNNGGQYLSRNWTGDNSVDWTATDARTDQTISGKAITLRNGTLSNDVAQMGGIGTLTFDYARIFSGSSTLKVYVNDTQYGGDIIVSSLTPTTATIPINESGSISLKFENSGKRTKIDNVSWTCFNSSGCSVSDLAIQNATTCSDNGTPNDASDDYFTADVIVTYNNEPSSGTIDLTGSGILSTGTTAANVTSSPQTISGVRLKADGNDVEITATFSDENTCTYTETIENSKVDACSSTTSTCNYTVGGIYISELSYNPATNQGSDANCEYIEIFNAYSEDVNLDGWRFTSGINYTFTSSQTIPSGGYIILASNSSAIAGCYTISGSSLLLDWGSESLVNSGGTVTLVPPNSCSGATGQSVTYSDGSGNADGDGDALYFTQDGTQSSDSPTPGSGSCSATADSYPCNNTACSATLTFSSSSCNQQTAGSDDTYDVEFGFDIGSESGIFSVTVNQGSAPSTISSSGTLTVANIPETENLMITVSNTNCTLNETITAPSCNNASNNGSLTFQMINPCGNDGDNEFVVFTSGDAVITIDNVALGSVQDESDNDWNYFWSTNVEGGNGPKPTENGNANAQTVQGSNGYGIYDPITDASTYMTAISTLHAAAGNPSTPIFIAPDHVSGEIPANSNVVFFLGYGSDGFNDAVNNLDFTPQTNDAPFYVILGKGDGNFGFFSNSSSRIQYITIGNAHSHLGYNPNNPKTINGGGGSEYLNNDGIYYEDGNCIPTASVILPVNLINFNAKKRNTSGVLTWKTASEVDNDYFEVLRSTDGKSFRVIGIVEGNGNTRTETVYKFIDKKPSNGKNYYRLRQIDFNGSYSLSKIESLLFNYDNSFIYPTNAQDYIQIKSLDDNEKSLRVYDILGRSSFIYQLDNKNNIYSVEHLLPGHYFLKINNQVHRFIKK